MPAKSEQELNQRAKARKKLREEGGYCLEKCVNYIPHSTKLRALICTVCGQEKMAKPKLLYYNKKRRQYKIDQQLCSLVCPLSRESNEVLAQLRKKHGIHTNTATTHITFAEGLPPERETWKLQSLAFQECLPHSLIRVTGIASVPTYLSTTQSLVLLNLKVDNATSLALQPLQGACLLPQYPLHCTLGTLETTKASKLTGKRFSDVLLTVDVECFGELQSCPRETRDEK